ncbi:WD40 repeat-like protein [Hesseltinella vesiculosa]|uniref:WD40 repeat-like protein n=1 Tax=Hesseltinella vesiculosa TaxID=101127 RepID=A0A1X2G8K5_9FUNG|nr:WD40 repeat-like protein [Hesseltinella vesiculosa]
MLSEIAVTTSNTDSTIYAWDIRSGSTLFSFKQNKSNGVCIIPRPGAPNQTGAIMTAQTDRASLHLYDWQRDQILQKMLTPEKMITLAASNHGHYTAGASSSGKIYIWHNASGALKHMFDAHYQPVTCLTFTKDDSALISASEDATVKVWPIVQLCSTALTQLQPSPLYSWIDHTLPVSAVYAGSGSQSNARIYTASADFTVKVWDLASGELLTTFLFPKPVTAIVMHPAETQLFAACGNDVYKVDLYRQRQHQRYDNVQGVGGQGAVEHVDANGTSSVFKGHSDEIRALSISFDGSLLVSASQDGNAFVWDVASLQQLRTFASHKGPVTGIECVLRPIELSMGTLQQKHASIPVKTFKRTISAEDGDKHLDVEQQLAPSRKRFAIDTQSVDDGDSDIKLSRDEQRNFTVWYTPCGLFYNSKLLCFLRTILGKEALEMINALK